MRLLDYLGLVRRRLPLVVAVMGVVAIVSFALSLSKEPMYEAATRLRALPPAPLSRANEIVEDAGERADLATEAHIIQGTEVAEKAAEILGTPGVPAPALIGQIRVIPVSGTAVLFVVGTARDPLYAQALANAFADAYLEVRREDAGEALDFAGERLSTQMASAQQRLEVAEQRLREVPPGSLAALDLEAEFDLARSELVVIRAQLRDLADRSSLERGYGEIIQLATQAKLVRSSSPVRSLVFGALLGGPLALAIVLLLDSLNETVRGATDTEVSSGTSVIGLIPLDDRLVGVNGNGYRGNGRRWHVRRRNGAGSDDDEHDAPDRPLLAVDADPFSVVSEAYRTASHNLATVADEAGARTIMLTSPVSEEGKTTTAANIAVSYAERGEPVVLVEADLRRPDAHELFGAEAAPGLAELVAGEATARKVLQELRPDFSFVGSGRPVERPDRELMTADLEDVLAKLDAATRPAAKGRSGKNPKNGRPNGRNGRNGGTILLDGAPLLQAAESLALAQAVDGVVLVFRAGVTRRQAAHRAAEQVRRSGGRLLGVILVGVEGAAELGLGGRNGRRFISLVNGSQRYAATPAEHGT